MKMWVTSIQLLLFVGSWIMGSSCYALTALKRPFPYRFAETEELASNFLRTRSELPANATPQELAACRGMSHQQLEAIFKQEGIVSQYEKRPVYDPLLDKVVQKDTLIITPLQKGHFYNRLAYRMSKRLGGTELAYFPPDKGRTIGAHFGSGGGYLPDVINGGEILFAPRKSVHDWILGRIAFLHEQRHAVTSYRARISDSLFDLTAKETVEGKMARLGSLQDTSYSKFLAIDEVNTFIETIGNLSKYLGRTSRERASPNTPKSKLFDGNASATLQLASTVYELPALLNASQQITKELLIAFRNKSPEVMKTLKFIQMNNGKVLSYITIDGVEYGLGLPVRLKKSAPLHSKWQRERLIQSAIGKLEQLEQTLQRFAEHIYADSYSQLIEPSPNGLKLSHTSIKKFVREIRPLQSIDEDYAKNAGTIMNAYDPEPNYLHKDAFRTAATFTAGTVVGAGISAAVILDQLEKDKKKAAQGAH